MGIMGKAVKAVAPMMTGEAPYDANTVREAAKSIKMHSGEALTKLFPEGSTMPPSEAKGEIWSDWEAFSAMAEKLDVYADGLAGAAENGLSSEGSDTMSASGMMGTGSGSMSGDMMAGSDMMGGGMVAVEGSEMMSAEEIAAMPADAAFGMVSQVCSACHSRFRAETK